MVATASNSSGAVVEERVEDRRALAVQAEVPLDAAYIASAGKLGRHVQDTEHKYKVPRAAPTRGRF